MRGGGSAALAETAIRMWFLLGFGQKHAYAMANALAGSARGVNAAEGKLGGEGRNGGESELSRARQRVRERGKEPDGILTTRRSFGCRWT
jgi:hypothetical protein